MEKSHACSIFSQPLIGNSISKPEGGLTAYCKKQSGESFKNKIDMQRTERFFSLLSRIIRKRVAKNKLNTSKERFSQWKTRLSSRVQGI